MIGKTFLRLERDFDKHVSYCRDEPNAQDFLANNDEVRDFFEVSCIQHLLVLIRKKKKHFAIYSLLIKLSFSEDTIKLT